MEDLIAAVLPLVQYDMFSWREDKFFANVENTHICKQPNQPPLQSLTFSECACGSTGREGSGHAVWVVGGLASTNRAHGQRAISKE